MQALLAKKLIGYGGYVALVLFTSLSSTGIAKMPEVFRSDATVAATAMPTLSVPSKEKNYADPGKAKAVHYGPKFSGCRVNCPTARHVGDGPHYVRRQPVRNVMRWFRCRRPVRRLLGWVFGRRRC